MMRDAATRAIQFDHLIGKQMCVHRQTNGRKIYCHGQDKSMTASRYFSRDLVKPRSRACRKNACKVFAV